MREKTEERRQAILQAAEKVFQDVGYERASMAQICAEVGFSKATLYSYYASKQELFAEALLSAVGEEFQQRLEIVPELGEDLRSALFHHGTHYLHLVSSSKVRAIRRLVASEADRSELGFACYEKGPARGTKMLGQCMNVFIERGKLKPGDPELMGCQYRALLEARWFEPMLFQVVDSISPDSIEQSVNEALDVFIAAYGVEKVPRL